MVIIIGASGFIGYYAVKEFLAQHYEVLGTGLEKDNPALTTLGAQYCQLDITKPEMFERLPKKNVDGVILLAGLLPANANVDLTVAENADDYIKINTLGTCNVLEYCRKNGIKKIIATTSYADVFKHWRKGVALDDDLPRAFNFTGDHAAYVISKNAATDLILYYNEQHGLQGSIFRLPPVYGVGPHNEIYVNGKYYKTGIQTFIEKAQAGEPIEIWGDPTLTRDIVYVKDVARALWQALQSDRARGVYNLTSQTELSLLDQVKTIIKVYGGTKKSKIVYRPEKKNNTPSFLFSIAKAKRDFGYAPQYTDYQAMMLDYQAEENNGTAQAFARRISAPTTATPVPGKKKNKIVSYLILYAVLFCGIFLSSLSGVCAKYASGYAIWSWGFILCYALEIFLLGLFALIWQQVIKRLPLSIAYSTKAFSLVWALIFGIFLFNEVLNAQKIIGILVVMAGVVVTNVRALK